jgi:pentatricopeptide repeat protein
MRVCVAVGDIESSNKLLDGLRDSRNMIPDSMKSDLYTLALKGCAKTGNSDVAQVLLKEMQDTGLNPT